MPRLFGLDIAKIINDEIAGAGGVLDATLIQVTPGRRSATNPAGGTNPVVRSRRAKGFIDDYAERQIAETIVQTGDRRIILLGASIQGGAVPTPGDRIMIEGDSYQVIRVMRDPAAATYTCQVRG